MSELRRNFTADYRGFPSCTLSQHPNNIETGYRNVLEEEQHEMCILVVGYGG